MKDVAVTRVLHRNAAEDWARLELVEQLGNVGSEVERAIRAHEAGRPDRFESALERALELFDLTAGDPRWRGHRCQEILRAREQFCRLFFDPDVPPDSARGHQAVLLRIRVGCPSASSSPTGRGLPGRTARWPRVDNQ